MDSLIILKHWPYLYLNESSLHEKVENGIIILIWGSFPIYQYKARRKRYRPPYVSEVIRGARVSREGRQVPLYPANIDHCSLLA